MSLTANALVLASWHRLMTSKMLEWDRDAVTDGQRLPGAHAHARSGILMWQATGLAVRQVRGAPV